MACAWRQRLAQEWTVSARRGRQLAREKEEKKKGSLCHLGRRAVALSLLHPRERAYHSRQHAVLSALLLTQETEFLGDRGSLFTEYVTVIRVGLSESRRSTSGRKQRGSREQKPDGFSQRDCCEKQPSNPGREKVPPVFLLRRTDVHKKRYISSFPVHASYVVVAD